MHWEFLDQPMFPRGLVSDCFLLLRLMRKYFHFLLRYRDQLLHRMKFCLLSNPVTYDIVLKCMYIIYSNKISFKHPIKIKNFRRSLPSANPARSHASFSFVKMGK